MKDDGMPALPKEVEGLLAAERDRPGLDEAALARVKARIDASVAGAPPPRGGHGGGARRLGYGITFVAGVLVGVAIHAAFGFLNRGRAPTFAPPAPRTPPAPTERVVSRPVSEAAYGVPSSSAPAAASGTPVPLAREEAPGAPVSPTPAGTSPAAAPSPGASDMAERARPPPASRPRRPRARAPEPATSVPKKAAAGQRDEKAATDERDLDLAAERALLDTARTALARSQGRAALDTLGRHAERFPAGRLAEEREALLVQALVQLRRFDEARRAAERFRDTYPKSMLLPVIDAALGSIPGSDPTP